jgi:hypothetical protein
LTSTLEGVAASELSNAGYVLFPKATAVDDFLSESENKDIKHLVKLRMNYEKMDGLDFV